MSKAEREMYKKVRRIMVSDLKRDLIGPAHDESDVIYEAPSQAYITGILYPLESEVETEKSLEDVQFADVYDEPESGMEEDVEQQRNSELEQEAEEEKITPNKKFKHQNSLGIRCYVRETTDHIRASIAWGGTHHLRNLIPKGKEKLFYGHVKLSVLRSIFPCPHSIRILISLLHRKYHLLLAKKSFQVQMYSLFQFSL
ncbi:hypothetical protein RSC3_00689 [Bacillus paralicheniformis]|nr:hypothetical protein RSC3_00689 [Bacillus paralicheniformis]